MVSNALYHIIAMLSLIPSYMNGIQGLEYASQVLSAIDIYLHQFVSVMIYVLSKISWRGSLDKSSCLVSDRFLNVTPLFYYMEIVIP